MPSRRRIAFLLLVLSALASTLAACRPAPAADLLAGKQPMAMRDVDRARLLTDGVAAPDGSGWDTSRTAPLRSPGAYAVYDLGAVTPIRAAWVHGDNNDAYVLSVSNDAHAYRPLWIANAVPRKGGQARWTRALHGSGRKFGSWSEWYHKVSLLDADAHVNPVSLRTVIAGSEANRTEVLKLRAPLLFLAGLGYLGLLALACRGKRREQAAMLGLILLPVLMYAANYYEHVVCLLPLLAVERSIPRRLAPPDARPLDATDAWLWVSLLTLCAAQYFTTLVGDIRLHFYFGSVLLMATLAAMLVLIVRRDCADLFVNRS